MRGFANLSSAMVIVLIGLLAVGRLSTGQAQHGTPAAAEAPPVTTQVLGRVPSQIAPGQALALMRVTFAPGASAAPHTHPGESIFHLASGTLHFTLHDGEAQLVRVGEGMPAVATPAAAEVIPIGEEITLTAGDTIYYTATTAQSERNDGDEDAVILLANLRGSDEPLRQAHDE